MKPATQPVTGGFFGSGYYFIAACILGIPVWLATESYVKTIGIQEDEAASTAITICFFAGVFAGRYLAQAWTSKLTKIPVLTVALLGILSAACIGWLFFHADFPIKGRAAINLLLHWLPFVVASLAIGMLAKIVRSVIHNQLQEARGSAAKSETELQLLQSQLSPHFLFNTLNNLYGLSITQHEKLPPLLLKLSELLRYSVYEANEAYTPLNNELKYINNYIDFERIRLGDRLVLHGALEQLSNDIKIAPMLLIVFIENAFKHSRNTHSPKIYIDIALKTWENKILFSVKNSHHKVAGTGGNVSKHSGFGLDNVRKRLDLLYPGEYNLEIDETEEEYAVLLQLKIKK